MKTLKFIVALSLSAACLLAACKKEEEPPMLAPCAVDPCANPRDCPGQCPEPDRPPGTLPEGRIETEGDFTKTGGKLRGNGKLTFNLSCRRLTLEVEDAEIAFDSDDLFQGLTGKIRMPKGDECFLLGPPSDPGALLQVDMFFFSGEYINEHYRLPFPLEKTGEYFILAVKSDLSLGLCEPGSAAPKESLTFNVNLGQLLWLLDPCDPLEYVDGRSDLLGGLGIGSSKNGRIRYVANFPVNGEIEDFGGKSVRYGAFSVKTVLELEGTLIENLEANARLATKNFLDSELELGYSAGFNGSMGIGLILFTIPLTNASAGLKVRAGTGGAGLNVFLRGVSDPFESWWPDVIPFKPILQNEIRGSYISNTNRFELVMRDKFGIMLPSGPSKAFGENSIETEARITNDEFSFSRDYTLDGHTWKTQAVSRENESELSAAWPETIARNFRDLILDRIGYKIEVVIDPVGLEFDEAWERYRLALDLQGLRWQIPLITQEARKRIADEVRKAKAQVDAQVPGNLCNSILCPSGNRNLASRIKTYIDNRAKTYYNILDDLDKAVDKENDNATTRAQLKSALQKLAANRRFTADQKFGYCLPVVCASAEYHFKFDEDVLSNSDIELLNQAIQNVDRIPEASGQYLAAKDIWDRLQPIKDRINAIRDRIEKNLEDPPLVVKVGFVKTHADNKFTFYFETPAGERKTLLEFDPYDFNSFIDVYYELP
jgi:hypothetical protein